ncbi:MAG: hypothetical protein OXI55_16355 [Gammaproteobacteria bacterium]|nr:hypothetical protein [Gammaproteobacteria bacterium]
MGAAARRFDWTRQGRLASRRMALALAAGMLLGAASLQADALAAARAAFDAGRFLEAAEQAASVGSADGLVLAAGALRVHGSYLAPAEEQKEYFQQAMEHAQAAVEMAPDDPRTHVESSSAIGRYAQTIGIGEALTGGYGGKMRDALHKALELDPDNAIAQLALGSWHANVVDRTGALVGRMTFGATRKKAMEHLDRALALAPNDKTVLLETGTALLVLDADKHRERALELLEAAVAIPPSNAYETLLHGQALERLEAVRTER